MNMNENNGNGFYMPVAPAYMGGYGNGGFGGFGGDWGWIILLLLCAGGGWGFGGMNGFGGGLGIDFPWLMNGQQQLANGTQAGFRDAQLSDGINGIRDGINGISTQLCNGFNSAEIAANGRQMADMQQMFSLQSALQQCCCDNRAATADLKYTIATEACASRATSTENTQKIMDKLCQLELDGVKGQLAQAQRDNVSLQNQLNIATFRESQTAQSALFTQGLNNEVDALYNRLSSCPVPTTPVYGRTPIFTCNNNSGCGCSGNAFVN